MIHLHIAAVPHTRVYEQIRPASMPVQALAMSGGPANDTFRVAEAGLLSGNITGGGGQNVIDYTPSVCGVVIELNKQRANRIKGKLFDIHHAIGGAGDDFIIGDDSNNVLAGGPGNDVLVFLGGLDVLFGQDDRDILIGGAGGDALLGGDGEDILIGGTTAHDNSLKSLARLMDE